MLRSLANRYAAWIDSRRAGLIVLSLLVAMLGAYLASTLPLRSDLSSLLPESRRSVQDLRALQTRASAFGRVFVMVEADDPGARARAAELLAAGLHELNRRLGRELVGHVGTDDGPIYQFVWRHRFLYAELADLTAARDALVERIQRAKLDANPLFIDLDDDEPAPAGAAAPDRLAELRTKLAEAEQKAARPPAPISKDQRIQMITIHTTFASSDQRKANALLGEVHRLLGEIRRDVVGVTFGVTGTVTMSLAEHRSVIDGMVMAGVITMALCGVALLLYFRSKLVVLATLWALVVGVLATLGLTWATIGHLNVMSAFLTAIVIGNGINPGLILVSRYLEEVRGGRDPVAALGPAIAGALPGTGAAMLTATVAYTSLIVSDFRGFRHFGVIAGLGMVLTWIAAFTILPALLAVLARRDRIQPRPVPGIGKLLRRLMPRRLGPVLAGAAVITAAGIAITVDYIAANPFTRDWRDLQSTNPEIRALRALDQKLATNIPGSSRFSGLSYQLVIGVEQRAQVAPLVAQLRALDRDRAPADKLFLEVRSIEDLLPADQPEKLRVLAELRALIDGDLAGALAADERELIAKLRPPDELTPLTEAALPDALAWPFIERDRSRGRLIAVRGATRFKTWNVADRQVFAAHVRALELPPGVVIGGEPLVIADIVDTMERDAPIMILVALLGSMLAVVLVLGISRHALVTVLCGFSGVAVMIAGCALVGLRVNFLDLIALPITIGIGIDYAVNLAAREREPGATRDHLAATAAAVVLCSYTTTVGYASLLFSANGGIRAFGLAAIIGELACVFTAMILAPAMLMLLRERRDRRLAAGAG